MTPPGTRTGRDAVNDEWRIGERPVVAAPDADGAVVVVGLERHDEVEQGDGRGAGPGPADDGREVLVGAPTDLREGDADARGRRGRELLGTSRVRPSPPRATTESPRTRTPSRQ